MSKTKKKIVLTKHYRLFDCNFYDYKPESNESDNDDANKYINPKFMVELYGIDESGETACIKVNNFKPFFYIKVSDDWTSNMVNPFKQWFSKKMGYQSKYILNLELVSKKKLYGFTHGKDSKFIKLRFDNVAGMNKARRLWNSYEDGEMRRVNLMYPMDKKECELELY